MKSPLSSIAAWKSPIFPSPTFLQNGKAIGFRLFNVRKGSIFERMGIKNGDVVREVNGTVIDSPAAASGLLDVIRTAENLELRLLRQGKPLSLSYTVR